MRLIFCSRYRHVSAHVSSVTSATMDQILANLADAVPDTFTDVSGEEAELPGEINDVMQV